MTLYARDLKGNWHIATQTFPKSAYVWCRMGRIRAGDFAEWNSPPIGHTVCRACVDIAQYHEDPKP